MSKNVKYGNIANDVTLSLVVTVPSKAAAGDVVPIGSDGLMGYLVTSPSEGVSNAATYATVRLLSAGVVVELPVEGSFTQGSAVYYEVDDNAPKYTDNVGGGEATPTNPVVGYVVEPQDQTPTAGKKFVFLGR